MGKVSTERRNDLDWLRLMAIIILLFYHTGMLFNPWGWHIKNSETSESFRYWMVWLHFWRMPLLLFISGAGTYMALGKRTTGQFAGERFKRLFLPLIFGIFVVVPPQIYFEHITKYDGYEDFYKTVFNFIPYPARKLQLASPLVCCLLTSVLPDRDSVIDLFAIGEIIASAQPCCPDTE